MVLGVILGVVVYVMVYGFGVVLGVGFECWCCARYGFGCGFRCWFWFWVLGVRF